MRTALGAKQQTPLKGCKRPGNKNATGGSPEKRECVQTPMTKLCSSVATFSLATPAKPQPKLESRTRSCSRTRASKNILNAAKLPLLYLDGDCNMELDIADEDEKENVQSKEHKSDAISLASTSVSRRTRGGRIGIDDSAQIERPEPRAKSRAERMTRSQSRSREGSSKIKMSSHMLQALATDSKLELEQLEGLLAKTPVKPIKLRLKKVAPGEKNYRFSESPFAKSPARVCKGKGKRQQQVADVNFEQSDEEDSSSGSDSDDEVVEDESNDDASDADSIGSNLSLRKSRSGKSSKKPAKKSSKVVKVTAPTVQKKVRKIPQTLEDLRSCLHTSEVPERMPCRELEYNRVRQFIENAVKPNGTSQAMYISGVPGTGKTATTLHVIEKIKEITDKFHSVYVNAMELLDPKLLFVKVYKEITGETRPISAQNARRKLNSMFEMADRKRAPIVVLVDELDQLCTKRQEIIYDVFNWTVVEAARVSVIAIANTLDLPERMLSQRITSRLGSNRVIFQPYQFEEIEQIISDRLQEVPDAVSKNAIQLASRRVAAISGDLRKAMDILRRAIEIAVAKKDKKLEIEHVNAAQKEAGCVPRVTMVVGLSRHSLILFKAAVSQVQSSGVDEFSFWDLYKQYKIMCGMLEGIAPIHEYGCHAMLMRLCSNSLLVASPGENMMLRKLRLGMTPQDAQFAIKQADDAVKSGQISYQRG